MEPGDTLQHLPEYLPGHCHLSKLKHQPPGMPPVEEARGFQRLLDEGMTKRALASAVGKQVQFVTMAVDMLTVRPDVLALVESGKIPALTAFQISKLDYDRQGQVIRAMMTHRPSRSRTAGYQDQEATGGGGYRPEYLPSNRPGHRGVWMGSCPSSRSRSSTRLRQGRSRFLPQQPVLESD